MEPTSSPEKDFRTKNNAIKTILILVLLGITGFLAWNFIIKTNDEMSDMWQDQFSNISADLTLENVKYSRLTPEGTKWTVRAARAMLYENSDIMDLDDVTITFVKNQGKIVIVADKGSYNRKNDMVSLKKNVIVKFKNGERLYAYVLNYSEKKQLIWSDEPVVLKRDDGLVINGKHMKYHVDTGLIVLRDQESLIPASAI